MTSLKEGSDLPYLFPKINGIFSTKATEWTGDLILKNEVFHVSEKLDGLNFCLSTRGWVASRNKIVSFRKNVESKMFHRVSLKNLKRVFENMDRLEQNLKTTKLGNFKELLVYGELILDGTSSSNHDIYDYRRRQFQPGDFLIFGLGFVYDSPDVQNEAIQSVLNNVMPLKSRGDKTFYLSMVNPENKQHLECADLRTVHFYKDYSIQYLLTDFHFLYKLKVRSTEGFVMHNSNAIVKFKFVEKVNDFYMTTHLNNLKTFMEERSDNFKRKERKVIKCLMDLYRHDRQCMNVVDKEKWNDWKENLAEMGSFGFFFSHFRDERDVEIFANRQFVEFENSFRPEEKEKPFFNKHIEMECKSELIKMLLEICKKKKIF